MNVHGAVRAVRTPFDRFGHRPNRPPSRGALSFFLTSVTLSTTTVEPCYRLKNEASVLLHKIF